MTSLRTVNVSIIDGHHPPDPGCSLYEQFQRAFREIV